MDTQHPTQDERYLFETNGYLVIENFLTPDHVALLRERLAAAMTRRRALEEKGEAHTGMTNAHGRNTRVFYILDDDPAFLDMLDHAPLMPYVHAFLGPKAHFHASDAIWEHGGSDRPGWHIDGHDDGYRNLGATIPLLQLKVGYYLTDMREPGQGNLTLVPGSHRAPLAPTIEQLRAFDSFPGARQVCGPAGTMFMFHNALWHTSGPWTKPNPERALLYYAYERPWMVGSAEHWRYPQSFYAALPPARREFFHGFVFDPPKVRWG
jgi:ectoine hydroxylase